jgi:hypothetical protein
MCFILSFPASIAVEAGSINPDETNRSVRSVPNSLPIPVINVSTDELLTLETLIINASGSYDTDGFVVGYFFQYEDGTESDWVTTPVVEHIYKKERFYNIRLKVMDDRGEESSYWAKITVNIQDRLPFIVVEEEITVDPNTEVLLEGYRCWDEDGHIINYSWEFEDNTTQYGPNVTHKFTSPGIYNIFLTILDDDRKTNKSSIRVIVREDEPVTGAQTLLGIIRIAVIAFFGVVGILFGRKLLPFGRGTRGVYKKGAYVLSPAQANLVQTQIKLWFKNHQESLPDRNKLELPEHAERFIYELALFESRPDSDKKSRQLSDNFDQLAQNKSDNNTLSTHSKSVIMLALTGILPNEGRSEGESGILIAALNAYNYSLELISKHELMGDARYYVPKTNEQESLAGFVIRKIWIRKLAQKEGQRTVFSDDDRKYTEALAELLAKCWKVAHSFKARSLSTEAKLYLTMMLCEKAGKRRFGHGKIEHYDVTSVDEELDLLDEFIEMFNSIWSILSFQEYQDKNGNSKLLCAFYVYELLGAYNYLGRTAPIPTKSRIDEGQGVNAS